MTMLDIIDDLNEKKIPGAIPISRTAWQKLRGQGYAVIRNEEGKTRFYVLQIEIQTGNTILQRVEVIK